MLKVRYRGKEFVGQTKESLYKNVEDFYSSKVPVENWAKDYIFSHAEETSPSTSKDFNPKGKMRLRFKDAVRGAAALVKVAIGQVVDQSEMNRRASICSSCVLKPTSVSDCKACGFSRQLTLFVNKMKKETFKSDFTIPNGMQDKFCPACKCSLAMMIPSKMSSFEETKDKQESRPIECWVRKNSVNYIQ